MKDKSILILSIVMLLTFATCSNTSDELIQNENGENGKGVFKKITKDFNTGDLMLSN